MAIYEYKCQHCNYQFELQRRMADADSTTICPDCASPHTIRLVSRVNAFSRSSGGESKAVTGGGCASCAPGGAHSCATCRH